MNLKDFFDFSTTSGKIKTGVRIAGLLLLVIFFLPTITVSCSGEEVVEFSAFEAGVGLIDEKMDEYETESIDPEFLALILVPMILYIIKTANSNPIGSAGMAFVSAAFMYVCKFFTEIRIKEDLGLEWGDELPSIYEVDTTFWFTLHILICVAIIVALMYERYILDIPENQEKIMAMFGSIKDSVSSAVSSSGSSKAGVCENCGNSIPAGTKFCGKCGAEYHEPPKKEKKYCTSCGTQYEEGDAFCTGCGKDLQKK